MRIIICAQRRFGMEVIKQCIDAGHEVVAVVTPPTDTVVNSFCIERGITRVESVGILNIIDRPHFDIGITAHFFDRIPDDIIGMAEIGWIGYHPSLLPRHRGRSSIQWALEMRDVITGGTIYWLNQSMDHGDIAMQDWIWLDHSKTPKQVWDDDLAPLGLRLFAYVVRAISAGQVHRTPQKLFEKFATYEKAIDPKG